MYPLYNKIKASNPLLLEVRGSSFCTLLYVGGDRHTYTQTYIYTYIHTSPPACNKVRKEKPLTSGTNGLVTNAQ